MSPKKYIVLVISNRLGLLPLNGIQKRRIGKWIHVWISLLMPVAEAHLSSIKPARRHHDPGMCLVISLNVSIMGIDSNYTLFPYRYVTL
jgi:hypothetical protein